MLDVLVVGAGPVGLTLAAELARYGLSVRIVDKAAHPTTTSKALAIWSRSLELFDRMGCTDPFLAAGIQGHGASIRSGGQVLGHARLDAIPSVYNFALMIPQRDTERLMAAHLAQFGVSVKRIVELASFADQGDHVRATLRHGDGRAETIGCQWLVGCDGAHSTVRHGLGVEFAGAPEPNDWVLADVMLTGPSAPPADEVSLYLHRDGLVVIFPMPGPRFRVVATLGATDPATPRPQPSLEGVQALIDALRFALGLAPIRDRMALQMSEIEIAYAESPLSVGVQRGAHGLTAGARLPPEHYAGAAPGAGNRPRFVLYAGAGVESSGLLEQFAALLEPAARTSPDPKLLLIARPDGYIGFAGKAGQWAEASAYLGGIAA